MVTLLLPLNGAPRMSRSTLPFVLVLPGLLLAAACEPTGSEAAVGAADATFTVQTVNSARVPSVVPFEEPPLYVGCQLVQSGGVLTLFANGRYTLQVSTGAVVCGGAAASWGGYAMTGDYRLDGEQITFTPDFGLPKIVGQYSPTGGGTVSGAGHNGVTPIPQITLSVASFEYQLTQEPSELP